MKRNKIAIALLIGVLSFSGVALYSFVNKTARDTEQTPDTVATKKLREAKFQYYEPSYIPGNHTIHRKQLSRIDSRSDVRKFSGYTDTIYLSLHEDNNVYSIREFNNVDGTYNKLLKANTTNNSSSCRTLVSPSDQTYTSCTSKDGNNIATDVRFFKGTTFIMAHLDSHPARAISTAELDKFVDSFQRNSGADLQFKQSAGAG